MPHPSPPSRAAASAPVAEAYLLVRQDLRDRIAAHPDEQQPLVHRALEALEALDNPPGDVIDGQPDPRSAQYQAEARDEAAREQLDP